MFKLKLAVVAAAASLIGITSAGAAFASYEDPSISVDVDPTTLVGGNSFDGTATSEGFDCNWSVTFRGETKTGNGSSFDFSFDTPTVSKKIFRDVVVTCEYNDDVFDSLGSTTGSNAVQNANYTNGPSAVLPAAIQTLDRTVEITILPKATGGSGDSGGSGGSLPDTGGVSVGWIYGGGALLLAGTATIVLARRRIDANA